MLWKSRPSRMQGKKLRLLYQRMLMAWKEVLAQSHMAYVLCFKLPKAIVCWRVGASDYNGCCCPNLAQHAAYWKEQQQFQS